MISEKFSILHLRTQNWNLALAKSWKSPSRIPHFLVEVALKWVVVDSNVFVYHSSRIIARINERIYLYIQPINTSPFALLLIPAMDLKGSRWNVWIYNKLFQNYFKKREESDSQRFNKVLYPQKYLHTTLKFLSS